MYRRIVGVGVNMGVKPVNDDGGDDVSDADKGLTDGAESGGGRVLSPPVGGGDAGDDGGGGEVGPGVKMDVMTVVYVVVIGWGGGVPVPVPDGVDAGGPDAVKLAHCC
ncbi:hypothetical protein BD410DRAFT_797318 [Rickenella mellea]|uniref:Uncharacterized protein n=1 Tax=Rickenella mellea TaxID=50990 RepID=A0A4Y7PFH2_9AGAM|nr:hypothetical protein BD410DRAFT_797318 [Rickenella mellea]